MTTIPVPNRHNSPPTTAQRDNNNHVEDINPGPAISFKDSEHGYPHGVPEKFIIKVESVTNPGMFIYSVDSYGLLLAALDEEEALDSGKKARKKIEKKERLDNARLEKKNKNEPKKIKKRVKFVHEPVNIRNSSGDEKNDDVYDVHTVLKHSGDHFDVIFDEQKTVEKNEKLQKKVKKAKKKQNNLNNDDDDDDDELEYSPNNKNFSFYCNYSDVLSALTDRSEETTVRKAHSFKGAQTVEKARSTIQPTLSIHSEPTVGLCLYKRHPFIDNFMSNMVTTTDGEEKSNLLYEKNQSNFPIPAQNCEQNEQNNHFDVLSTCSTTESIQSIQSFESDISDTSQVWSEPIMNVIDINNNITLAGNYRFEGNHHSFEKKELLFPK